jgi:hypothetical protein
LLLELTPAGRALLAVAPETAQSRIIATLEKMPERRRLALVNALQGLVQALGVAGAPPTMLLEPGEEPRRKGRQT